MELRALIMTGAAEILEKDFVMFTEEETEQLFLEYGVELIPQDIAWMVEVTWGTPFVLQAIARKKEKCPERSVQAIVPEVFDSIYTVGAENLYGVFHSFTGNSEELE